MKTLVIILSMAALSGCASKSAPKPIHERSKTTYRILIPYNSTGELEFTQRVVDKKEDL